MDIQNITLKDNLGGNNVVIERELKDLSMESQIKINLRKNQRENSERENHSRIAQLMIKNNF